MRNFPRGNPCLLLAIRSAILTLRCAKSSLLIAAVLLPASAWTQALPDAPAPQNATPPTPPDARWTHVERISDGQPIVVRTTSGALIHCRFAGATDASLFCDPLNQLLDRPGYEFDRTSVVRVFESHPERNWHPVLLTTMAIVGTVVGIACTENMDDRGAASAGLLSAGIVGLIGYGAGQFPMQGPYGGYGYGFNFRPNGFGGGSGRFPRLRMPVPIRGVGPRK
jgi:hypothetical protein